MTAICILLYSGIGDSHQEKFKHGEIIGVPVTMDKSAKITEIFEKYYKTTNSLAIAKHKKSKSKSMLRQIMQHFLYFNYSINQILTPDITQIQ